MGWDDSSWIMSHVRDVHKREWYGNARCGQVMVCQITSKVDDLGIELEYDTFKYLSTELTWREFKASKASIILRSVNRKLTS